MKELIENSLNVAQSYAEYMEMVLNLIKQGKSTGPVQSEDRLTFSKLNNSRMKRLDKQVRLSDNTIQKLTEVEGDFTWMVLTESWCGDAAQTLPVLNKFAESTDKIKLKLVLRDENEELMDQFLTNGSRSIPKVIVVDNSSNEVVGSWGPRSFKAGKMVSDYKAEHGIVDAHIKESLQRWYNEDKGVEIEREMLELIP